MRVTILGSGTSTGIPEIACDCSVCIDAKKGGKNNRLRASILLQFDSKTVLIDTSTDFRQQMLRYDIKHIDAVLLTHGHFDHIGGIDDVRPLNFCSKKSLDVYATKSTGDELMRQFSYIFDKKRNGSTCPEVDLHIIEREVGLFGKRFILLPIKHGTMDVVGFRIGDFAYMTDFNYVPESTKKLLKGVKTIILSAVRHLKGKPHMTHFTLEQSEEFAKEMGAKNVFYTHISHDIDHRKEKPSIGALAYDGMELEVE